MSQDSFYRRKLFSFLGLVPMAIYAIAHMAAHCNSWRGAEVWNQRLHDWHANPFYWPIIIVFVYLPFAFHAIYGIVLAVRGRQNIDKMPTFANTKYLLQRLSAIGVLLFLGAHVFKTRIEPGLEGESFDFMHMVEGMHHMPTIIVYALGVLGVAFHLANGFWLGGITWGITVGRKSQRVWQAWSIALFVIFALIGGAAMYGFMKVPFSGAGH